MKSEFSYREKLVVILIVLLIKIIKPWEYDHQFTEFWKQINECLEGKNDRT